MMDDDENDLDGLFEEYENGNEENADNNNGDANPSNPTENAEKIAAPRRAVKNPRLKFNADRLCGERGIPVVVKHFEGVKFKGKGHEVEDLNKLLSTLEHWCHRLYPSMKFDDCLRQIEKLGKKRPVQTCLRKIRMDMPILNDDFVHEEPEEENEIEVEIPPQDAFDRLISEIQGSSNTQLASTPLPVKTSAPEQRLGSFGSTLTEEQRQRMEYNKMLAAERRKAKFLVMQPSTVPTNESEDLFTGKSTSALSNSSNHKETNSMFDDLFNASTSLLSPKVDKLHPASNNSSEELELDDLVDLVNEDDEPSVIRNENNNANNSLEMHVQVNGQENIIDLSNECESDKIDKNYTEIVDLEKEVEESFLQNKTVEVINLESKINNTEPITVVNLEPETWVKISNPVQVINLENEEVDLTNEKNADDSNSDIELINAPTISSTDVPKENFEPLNRDKISDRQSVCETIQDDIEAMEID